MGYRVKYTVKLDKNGREYGLRTNLKTGKSVRVSPKYASKRITARVSAEKRADIQDLLDKEGAGGTYTEYKRVLEDEKKQVIRRRKETGGKPLTDAQVRSRAKRNTIRNRTGIACRYTYMWEYWDVKDVDEKGEDICDTSPAFDKGKLYRNGSEDFEYMIELVYEAYMNIVNYACKKKPINGGAYVVLFQKSDRKILDEYELPEPGKGKGSLHFSFLQGKSPKREKPIRRKKTSKKSKKGKGGV